ncbi:MAG: hypothetical protein NTW79_00840 [Candidatus Berkelbacteria bacterium]|nr:hypothetical protein [Candidatus Berkelbacteria bacterium]
MEFTSTKRSFGLIETLVACAILIILVGGLLILNITINNSVTFTRERAEAYYLAQEAVETMRQIRETNAIDSNPATAWNTFVCDTQSQLVSPNFSQSYGVGTCQTLPARFFLTANNSGENISVGTQSFNRKISFAASGIDPAVGDQNTTNANSLQIIVNVNWTMNGRPENIQLREVLTNWKQAL